MTYDEIRMKTIRAAQNLQTLGYESGKVIGIIAKNSDNVAPIFFASIALGCPVNCLDPSFEKVEFMSSLQRTKPELVFCDVECYDRVHECLMELGVTAKFFTFNGTVDQSEPVERVFAETHKENQFM